MKHNSLYILIIILVLVLSNTRVYAQEKTCNCRDIPCDDCYDTDYNYSSQSSKGCLSQLDVIKFVTYRDKNYKLYLMTDNDAIKPDYIIYRRKRLVTKLFSDIQFYVNEDTILHSMISADSITYLLNSEFLFDTIWKYEKSFLIDTLFDSRVNKDFVWEYKCKETSTMFFELAEKKEFAENVCYWLIIGYKQSNQLTGIVRF